VSDFFGHSTQNSFPLEVREHHPGHVLALPDVHAPGAEVEQPLDLGGLVVGREIEVEPVLDGLPFGDGDEDDARQGALVGADDELVLRLVEDLPAQGLAPEACQALYVLCVHCDLI
jgi:hypothetical protein